ncbi:hypothetical protein ACDH50_19800, partial [Xanthomonas fragariae]
MMESVRGIKTIKLANKQVERTIRLRNATVEMADRGMVAQRVTMAFQAISQLVFGMQRVILIGVGAYMIIGKKFSAGMIVEPPRDFGRLQLLRRWGDEQDEIFTGSARARGSAGAGASGRV